MGEKVELICDYYNIKSYLCSTTINKVKLLKLISYVII